jgi:1-acyl-sn-glycerol-3-phosphate acyltransferase
VLHALVLILLLPINLAIWGTLILLGGVVKLLTFGELRHKVILVLAWMGERWVQGNDLIFDAVLSTRWTIEGFDGLNRDGHYLLISNHISWVDIFAVLRAVRGRAPFVRFFLKHTLFWFPIVGQACWALEFPFMRRYTPEYLKQHPEKRGRDLETTRKACRRYQHIPVTILNFVEGTRFTRDKHEDQQSPYRHLLRPRAGGIGFVLASLGEQLDGMLDVTIVYPHRDITLWDFATNRVEWIRVHARRIDIPAEFRGAAITEAGPARESFKEWVEKIWREKDEETERILIESRS